LQSQGKKATAAEKEVRQVSSAEPHARAPEIRPLLSGRELYLEHCAACHGDQGNGQGIAARFLFPKPRNFASGRFRLISTTNSAPTPDDVRAVLMRGMPGSAMPPWAHLRREEIDRLVEEVLRLYREGVRAGIVKELKDLEEDIVEEDVAQQLADRTTPGDQLEVPQIAAADDAAVARGRKVYIQQSCHSCHGNEGKGDGQQVMVDNDGVPTRPRDLTKGIFKGGHDAASIYRRIALGMPGTPMPSSSTLEPRKIIDLAHYIRSLSGEDKRNASILKREKLVARRVAQTADEIQSDVWSQAPATLIKTMPLWWRDDADCDLHVQAVHDGKRIVFRLSWGDKTPDLHSARTEAFKDLAAIELYRGPTEPFIGMGAATEPVDLWVWDADRQTALASTEEQYPNAVVDIYPFTEAISGTAEFSRATARLAKQDPLALAAKAVGNQVTPEARPSGGSSLAAGGPGSVTFRLPANQAVTAVGEWRDGRWTCVLSRELASSEAGGIALSAGDKLSIAFAIWDGSHRDRNGQKIVSIWQDLELESETGKQ
jgi:mono/diheme cytochrome c family protein